MYECKINKILDEIICNRLSSWSNRKYVRELGIQGNEKVLDLGCGSGSISKHLAKALKSGGFLTCVDISDYWVDIAKKRMKKFSNVEFKVGTLTKLDLSAEFYDILFIRYALHEIFPDSPDQREKIFLAAVEKLKNNGMMFIREPIKASHGMPVSEIKSLMLKAGLKEVSSRENKSEFRGTFIKKI